MDSIILHYLAYSIQVDASNLFWYFCVYNAAHEMVMFDWKHHIILRLSSQTGIVVISNLEKFHSLLTMCFDL